GRANCRCHRWCKRSEDRIKPPHDLFLASDHQAIATSEAPGTAAGADVDVMDAFRFQCHGAIEVMAVMRTFAVDSHVVGVQMVCQLVDSFVDNSCWKHQPHNSGRA